MRLWSRRLRPAYLDMICLFDPVAAAAASGSELASIPVIGEVLEASVDSAGGCHDAVGC